MTNYPKLCKAFIKGLRDDHNLTYDDIKTWIFCGGQAGPSVLGPPSQFIAYQNYFHQCFPNKPFPQLKPECVCGVSLVHNCYIRKDINSTLDTVLIIGSCCIEKFIDAGKARKCEKCSSEHHNRKDNLCTICRNKILAERRAEAKKQKDIDTYNRRLDRKIAAEAEKERLLHLKREYFDIPYSISSEEDRYKNLKDNKCKWDPDVGAWWCKGNKYQIEHILECFEYYHISDIENFKKKKADKVKEYKDKNFIYNKMKIRAITFKEAVEVAKKEGLKWDNDAKLWYKQF